MPKLRKELAHIVIFSFRPAMMIPVYRNIFSGVEAANQMKTKMTFTYIIMTLQITVFFLSTIFYIVLPCELSWCVTCRREFP